MRGLIQLIIGLAALVAAGAAPPVFETLDLPGAIQMALLQNRELAQVRLAVESRRFTVRSEEAALEWRLQPEGTAAASSETETVGYGLTAARTLPAGTEVALRAGYARVGGDSDDQETVDRSSIRLQLSQPLFRNFGPMVQREPIIQAGHDLLTAWRTLEQRKAELAVQVAQVYEDCVRLERQVEADATFHARVDKLYRLTRARENQGRSTRVDTLRVEMLRQRAALRLAGNRERQTTRFQDLLALLGLDPAAEFALSPPLLLDLDLPPDPEEAVEVAFAHRLELAQAAQDIADTRRGIHLARRGLQPNLRFVSSIQQYGEGASLSDSLALEETGWTVGLAADTDFVRTREQAALGRRMLDRESAQSRYESTRDAIAREVRQGLLACRRSRRELEIAEHTLGLAGDRLRLAQRRFELGRGDNFTVTDAEDEFITAEQQWLSARAEASVEGYRLLRALGTLIPFPDRLRPDPETLP